MPSLTGPAGLRPKAGPAVPISGIVYRLSPGPQRKRSVSAAAAAAAVSSSTTATNGCSVQASLRRDHPGTADRPAAEAPLAAAAGCHHTVGGRTGLRWLKDRGAWGWGAGERGVPVQLASSRCATGNGTSASEALRLAPSRVTSATGLNCPELATDRVCHTPCSGS